MYKQKPPVHHLLVENASWSEVLKVRHDGASWDDLKTRTGLPALGMAIFNNSSVAVQLLLELGAPAGPQKLYDGSDWSPVWATLAKKNYRILDLLLRGGADPDEKHPTTGMTPLQIAAKAGDSEATLILCSHGSRPNSSAIPSPLWLWVRHLAPRQNPDTLKWSFPDPAPVLSLLSAGARINESRHQKSHMGMGVIELAKRLWFEKPLSDNDHQTAKLILSARERNALMERASEKDEIRRKDNKGEGQIKL